MLPLRASGEHLSFLADDPIHQGMPQPTPRALAILAAERLARARGRHALAALLAEQRRILEERCR
jgi:hypothetical protein